MPNIGLRVKSLTLLAGYGSDGMIRHDSWRVGMEGEFPVYEERRRPPAADQFIAKVARLTAEVAAITDAESAMNARLYELYHLTAGERLLVENDRSHRPVPANQP